MYGKLVGDRYICLKISRRFKVIMRIPIADALTVTTIFATTNFWRCHTTCGSGRKLGHIVWNNIWKDATETWLSDMPQGLAAASLRSWSRDVKQHEDNGGSSCYHNQPDWNATSGIQLEIILPWWFRGLQDTVRGAAGKRFGFFHKKFGWGSESQRKISDIEI